MNNKEYLEKILPHKQPMILIDNVLDYSIEELKNDIEKIEGIKSVDIMGVE